MSGQINQSVSQSVNQETSSSYKTGRSMNAQHLRLTFMHSLKSEMVKLRGLASTWWCMALAIVLPVVFSFIIAIVQKAISKVDFTKQGASAGKSSGAVTIGPSDKSSLISSQEGIFSLVISFASISFIVIAIFAVLAITAEHSTTSIQASLTSVPRRGMFFTAKFVAVAIGFGMICKSTAGGIMCVIGVVMILPTVLSIIVMSSGFAKWTLVLTQLLPATAASQFLGDSSSSNGKFASNVNVAFEWWQSGLVVLAWAVVMYVIGYMLEKHRDI